MTKFGLVFLVLFLGTAALGCLRGRTPEPALVGVAANQRLTALTGQLLFVLQLGIAVTILLIQPSLSEHYLIGFLMIACDARRQHPKQRTTGLRLARGAPLLVQA